jgi:hypothetical protein
MGIRFRESLGHSLLAAAILFFAVGCPSSDPKPDTKSSDPKSSGPKKTEQKTDASPAKTATSEVPAKDPDAIAAGDTLGKLLETLPKDSWPKEPKAPKQFDAASKWLAANLAGKRAIVTSSIQQIHIALPSKTGDPTRATLANGGSKSDRRFLVIRGFGAGGKVTHGLDLWGDHWSVELIKPAEGTKPPAFGLNLTVEKPELTRLRALEMRPDGPEARLTFTIDRVELEDKLVTVWVKDLVVDKAE